MAEPGQTPSRDDLLIANAERQIAATRKPASSAAPGRIPRIRVGDKIPDALESGGADGIPGYQILGERQRGGQGIVYEAIQNATRRRVAIKVLHAGPTSGMTRARFAREVEILARLRHPNIVTIHDCSSIGGRLFFVMDFIDGVSFDRFAAGVEDRDPGRIAAAFIKICDAVHAAHLRGVMHRDLKPSNLIVDDSGEPRVLDFGLAKQLDSADTTASPDMTETGQFIGSLLWASPEQLEGASDRIDLRCDVYSLGLILFQALTGAFPFEPARSVSDVARNVRESEPRRPSSLKRGLGDELDTIILKCLQKDPNRRYQTAGELGRDLQRYLAHEPIEAKRDSLIYLLRKRIRRHRLAVIASAAIIVASIAGLAVSLMFWRDAEQQRQRAERSEQVSARRADEAQRTAEFQARLLERIDPESLGGELLEAIRRQIQRSDNAGGAAAAALNSLLPQISLPDVARDTLTRMLIDPAEAELESQFAEHPAVEARLRDTLAELNRNLGRYTEAQRHVRRALEIRKQSPNADISEDLNRLGVILREAGDVVAAEAPQREAVEVAESLHGPESVQTATALDNLASLLVDLGRVDEGERLLRRSLAVLTKIQGRKHANTLICLNNLALLLRARGEYDEAEAIAKEVLLQRQATLKPADTLIGASLMNLALIQFDRGDLDAAQANLEQGVTQKRQALGGEHPEVAAATNALGMLLMARDRLDEAEQLFRSVLATQQRMLGDRHPDTATTRGNLGVLLTRAGRPEVAIPELRETLAAWTAILGSENDDVARTSMQLAEALLAVGDTSGAEPLLESSIAYYGKNAPNSRALSKARSLLERVPPVSQTVESRPSETPR